MEQINKKTGFLWEQMTWPEIEEYLKKVDTVLLPCGAIEQHGPHLPLDTDAFDHPFHLASEFSWI